MQNQPEKSNYYSGTTFYILQNFDEELRDGIIIPLTNTIDALAKQRDAMITFYINSRGGLADVCYHIIVLIELAKSRGIIVRTIVIDQAYSAGSIVAVAGTPGERYIAKTAEHCLHYGTQYGWAEHTPMQIDRNAAKKKRHFKKILDTYKKYSKLHNLAEYLKDDSFFVPAEKCIEWQLADKYIEELA